MEAAYRARLVVPSPTSGAGNFRKKLYEPYRPTLRAVRGVVPERLRELDASPSVVLSHG